MEKEFVPYEQALELKELGFGEPCFAIYNLGLSEFETANVGQIRLFSSIFRIDDKQSNISYVNDKNNSKVSAPLYQQAFRWFREKYKLFINISEYNKDGSLIIEITKNKLEIFRKITNFDITEYEEAELECLKKLIEIVKNK